MAEKLFFKHAKTGEKFEILGRDQEKGTVKLKGQYSEFEEPYDKETFKRLGYNLVREDVPDEESEDA